MRRRKRQAVKQTPPTLASVAAKRRRYTLTHPDWEYRRELAKLSAPKPTRGKDARSGHNGAAEQRSGRKGDR